MKVVSFNVNGIRARFHQLEALINSQDPDIICFQETKVHNDDFPFESLKNLGYEIIINGQKGHYGVATFYRGDLISSSIGFKNDPEDAQCRLITSTHKLKKGELTCINGYFPQGESRDHPTKFPYKKKFFEDLMSHLNENFSKEQNLINFR